jgi:integrase
MAYARERGSAWSARWRTRLGQNAEKSGFASKKEAIAYAQEQEAAERRYKNTRPSEMNITLREFVTNVWAETLDVTRQTKIDYQNALNSHVMPEFGDRVMNSITPAEIRAWNVRLKNSKARTGYQLSESTANKMMNLLASIFKEAVANEYVHKTPFSTIKRKKPKNKRKVVPLDYQTVQAIADKFAPQWKLLIWLGFYTGMRPSELLGLTYDRINFQDGEIRIDRQLSRFGEKVFEETLKTSSSNRVIKLLPPLRELVNEHVEKFGLGPHGLLFKNRVGNIWRYKDAAAMYRDVVRPLGVEKGEGLHQLRHTFVSMMIQIGGNPKHIQGWVGHESILETMDTYGHLFPDSFDELAGKFESYVQTQRDLLGERRMLA